MIILHRFRLYIIKGDFSVNKTKNGNEITLNLDACRSTMYFTINTIYCSIDYSSFWGLRINLPYIYHMMKYIPAIQPNSACDHYDHNSTMHYKYVLIVDKRERIPYILDNQIYKLSYTIHYVYAGCNHDCKINKCVNCDNAKRCATMYHSVELSTCYKALRIIHIVNESSNADVLQECIDRYINYVGEEDRTLPTRLYHNGIKLLSCKF